MARKQKISSHFEQNDSVPNDVMGRNRLAEWLEAQPENLYSSDLDLQRKLELYLRRERYRALLPNLYKFGQVVSQEIDPLARSSNLNANLPSLQGYNEIGQPIESVAYHPDYHAIGRLTYAHRLMSAHSEIGNNIEAMSLFYLSAQNGEAGHNCPLACTAGLVKILQHVATPALKERFLPRILDEDYDRNFTGAQYLTEVQGGSDVGLNAVTATPEDSDSDVYYLNGQKWFCSNVTADLALVTARVSEAPGTKGLGLFLVPRLADDGSPNGYTIQRLKDKLGTRSLATGEVIFEDAKAWRVGNFNDAMTHVINTSRIYNAFGCAGNARRALTIAWTYAQNRLAFEQPIIRFPIVQDQIAKMRANVAAILAGSMRIAMMWDKMEKGGATEDEQHFMRMAVNLNKYRSSLLSHEVIVQAIEILGGNGAIESFSILPRLLRDNIVYENWEGTHNVLMAQVLRDMRKLSVHEPFMEMVDKLFEGAALKELKDEGRHQLGLLKDEIEEVLKMDDLTAGIYMRPLMDRITDLYYTACMAAESGWERKEKDDKTKARLAIFYLNRWVIGKRPGEITYYDDQVSRLSSEI